MQAITLLGATGSIGSSTLEVMRRNPGAYRLHAAAAATNVEAMLGIISEFRPARAAMADARAAAKLKEQVGELSLNCEVLSGAEGVIEIAGDGGADQVIAAIVGAAGLRPVLAAVKTSCTIGLANKEALVMSGQLFFSEVRKYGARVLPIDSEHSAIFQCLPEKAQQELGFCSLKEAGVHKILLTGSGGPFRTLPLHELKNVTAAMALNHPVWSMGPKITIDSATMMNKGLEFIEARYLFNARDEDIEVLVHPQSIIHSMVSYVDGAIVAQLGQPDMKTPIARALAYPDRIGSGVAPLDFFTAKAMSFERPDFRRYPCLKLAMQASRSGQGATTALNAGNEVAVQAFLDHRLRYVDIAHVAEGVLDRLGAETVSELDEILDLDRRARVFAAGYISGWQQVLA